MNTWSLAKAGVRARPLHSLLSVISTAVGIGLICALLMVTQLIERGLSQNSRGVDLIVGAKGSPLQLILSTLYQADVPAGNIEFKDYQWLRHLSQVRAAIPLALGDNFQGWRLLGSTPEYLKNFNAHVGVGHIFDEPFEVVVGAQTKLPLGQSFAARHGFSADSEDIHDNHLFQVVGVLKPTGTILDRMIITSLESVQQLHSDADPNDADAAEEMALGHQVTAVLLKVNSPVAIMNLPRQINHSTNMLAASPSYEIARFAKSMGMGRDILLSLGLIILMLSLVMLFTNLSSNLSARRYDLAILRVLGASPMKLWSTVLLEGMILGGMGALLGLVVGHVLAYALAASILALKALALSELLTLQLYDVVLLLAGVLAGAGAGLIPALTAARTDIAGLLARGTL